MSISSMLVPVTLDHQGESVIAYVAGLRAQSVQHVIVATSIESDGVEPPVLAAEIDRARAHLAVMAEPLKQAAMHVELRVATGDTAHAILALARQTDVDVICLGTEGKSAIDYLLSGSISEDLFSSGRIRTMAVRFDLLEESGDPGQLGRDFGRRLVVPTDFSASSMRAFMSVFDRPVGAMEKLHLLHVLHDGDSSSARRDAEVKLEGMKEIAEEHDVTVEMEIRSGDSGDVVLDYLDEVHATGVILGQRGRGRLRQVVFGGVFGHISMRLLREAPCPVVVQP